MSWILGFVGKSLSPDRRERLTTLGANPVFQSLGEGHYVACGGIPETCLYGSTSSTEWAVLGTGVRVEGPSSRILTVSDWHSLLQEPRPDVRQLGGGFVAIRWSPQRLEAFGDAFGLRSLYWKRTDDGVFFSTRLDWLNTLFNGLSIDWKAFGSHWLTYHQLSARSLLQGVERLGPAGYARFTASEHESGSFPYTPSSTEQPLGALLRALLQPDDGSVSLGLSGGMDSRVLLALGRGISDFGVHIFGSIDRTDTNAAVRIAEVEAVPYRHLHLDPPSVDELAALVRSHAVRSHAVSPASAALSLRYYPELRRHGQIVVDGGFGEILRRQFMNRLLRKGERAIAGRDAVRALEHVRFTRAAVFTRECTREMIFGARRDLAHQLDMLADLRDFDLPDRVDVLNVRTRLPNFFGYEQARLDGTVQSYMPFAHPMVVDAAIALPSDFRKNGRAARRLIMSHAPSLRKHPLVKGDVRYPYRLPPLPAAAYVKARKRLARRSGATERDTALHLLKDFVLDRIGSAAVRGCGAYDTAALDRLAEGYYADGNGGAQLDWWLAFDLWRDAVAGTT